MGYSNNNRRQTWITVHRVVTTVLLVALVVVGGILLTRPAPTVPTVTEIAQAVNGPVDFRRPGALEYVAKTDSCVVGGTVTSAKWHIGNKTVPAGSAQELEAVDYTEFGFRSDAGRDFTVSANDALFTEPGENLGLELECDPATMNSDSYFGMIAIIWGGK